MTIFYSKKFWVSLAGLVLAILAANGVVIPEDIKSKVIELITVIAAAYNIGQGVADGVSKGATSGVARRVEALQKGK
jgi:hypothetical protein